MITEEELQKNNYQYIDHCYDGTKLGVKTKYRDIDNLFYIDDSFMKEAFADVNDTMKLGEARSLIKLAPTENAKIPVLSGTIPAVIIQLSAYDENGKVIKKSQV